MLKPLARANRRRMTDAELRLWTYLRPLRAQGLAFRRQSVIGSYIIDFECRRARLCVEVDGAQHFTAQSYDAERTKWLRSEGYEVLRFWNYDVMSATDTIVEHIIATARQRAVERRP